MTMSQHQFRTTSYFDSTSQAFKQGVETPRQESKVAAKERTVSNKQLEDWSYRIEQCAYEADDQGLPALYSDLLDLREEIVYLLYQNV